MAAMAVAGLMLAGCIDLGMEEAGFEPAPGGAKPLFVAEN
jgi:hypothetical protein